MTRAQIEEEKRLRDGLTANKVYPSDFSYEEHPVYGEMTCILIEWGDWKHEHLRCDWLMREMGYTFFGSETVEDDGSDTYSAIRKYYKEVA